MAEYVESIGRRKTSTARVRLYPGNGEIVVNDKTMPDYFGRSLDRMILMQPLRLTGTEGSYNISIHVSGGGESGQASAARHGISRALVATEELDDLGMFVEDLLAADHMRMLLFLRTPIVRVFRGCFYHSRYFR